jgi:acetolactate synthase I/II/III large subunit
MSKVYRGADALVRTLAQAGVRRVFTLSGNHIMSVFDACLDQGISLVHTRHEAAAVHMADAWARLTGEVGVAMVTGGPGHANAVAALYTAQMSESPVVLLSGQAPEAERGLGAFQEMRQADMAAPVTKASWSSAGAAAIAGDACAAIGLALGGRPGPVHLSLPSDALEGACETSRHAAAPPSVAVRAPLLAADSAAKVVDWLADAKRPLILCGPASLTPRGRRTVAALEEHTGVPVVGMESPRGISDPSLGAFPEVLAQADRILLLGKRLDFTLKFGRAPAIAARCGFVQIDPDDDEIHRSRRVLGERLALAVRADTAGAIKQLCAQPTRSAADDWRNEVHAALRARGPAQASATAGVLHPWEACTPLQEILDSDPRSVLVCDGGEFGQWAQACLHAPNRLINGPAGAIGGALPMAVAARLAVPDAPVIALMGDGTAGFHIAEFDTALRYKLPFVAIVGNDARWNAEYQIQLKTYGKHRTIGCELLPSRYDHVCAAFGGYGELVETGDQVAAATRRALACGRAACINVALEGAPAPAMPRRPLV